METEQLTSEFRVQSSLRSGSAVRTIYHFININFSARLIDALYKPCANLGAVPAT